MNLGMYMINKFFHGYFACTIFIHSLYEINSLAALVRLFYTTCEQKSYALTNREIPINIAIEIIKNWAW